LYIARRAAPHDWVAGALRRSPFLGALRRLRLPRASPTIALPGVEVELVPSW
jgi:hypothetical protein